MGCNVTNNVGTCVPLTVQTQDPGRCDDSHGGCGGSGCMGCGSQCACDGSGNCDLKNGQSCTCDANCASGRCDGGENDCNNTADATCD
jgi:hypothetical protein